MHYRKIINMYFVFYMVTMVYTGYRDKRSGTWTNWIGENNTCPLPSTPEHGEISLPNGILYGTVVVYGCNTGYRLLGDQFLTCSFEGVWEGVAPTCVRKCDNGSYGEGCERICGSCALTACDPITGSCSDGCLTGYKGENCSQSCDSGYYGPDCATRCGHCRLTPCNFITGVCRDGCLAGYQGILCTQPCAYGTYGLSCRQTCSCENGISCNTENGYCHCGVKQIQNGGNTEYVQNTSAIVSYSCNPGFELVGHATLTCNRSTGIWDYAFPTCVKTGSKEAMCPDDVDFRGTPWAKALPDEKRTLKCPDGFSGNVTRRCDPNGKWSLPSYNCIRGTVEAVHGLVATIGNTTTSTDVARALEQISSLASVNTQQDATLTTDSQLTDGELNLLSMSLDKLASALSKSPQVVDDNVTDTFLKSVSNMIDNSHQESWKALDEADGVGAAHVLSAVESFVEALSSSLNTSEVQKRTIVKTNLAMEVNKCFSDGVSFPGPNISNDGPDWIKNSKSSIRLDAASFKDSTVQYVTTAVMYRNLSEIIPSKTSSDAASNKKKADYIINGPILALSVSPSLAGKLDPPVHISFEHQSDQLTEPSCRFWLFKSGSEGYWSNTGCSVHFTNESYTVCECNHLTNFAVLMSPFQEADVDSVGLRVVSIIGIAVSIFCLLATLAMHILLWKYLKNDRTVLLANLCVALVLSYILFLAGVDRTENSVVCAVVAACLHYIYLVVFCLMLAEGIEMAITVLYVFKTKLSRIRWLLLLSWLLPAVIVGISLGVTKAEGFGNEKFCWLSTNNGLIWAFIGPAMTIILFNIGCLILVLRAIFHSRTVEAKESSEKVKTGFRSLCILLPVTGVSWILGIFYISEDFSFIQYIFAVCNGCQGFFLFLFHCLLSPQVKRAFILRKRKKYAISSLGKSSSQSVSGVSEKNI